MIVQNMHDVDLINDFNKTQILKDAAKKSNFDIRDLRRNNESYGNTKHRISKKNQTKHKSVASPAGVSLKTTNRLLNIELKPFIGKSKIS